MWYWICPFDGGNNEHHSLKDLEQMLTVHERGINVPGGLRFPGFRKIKGCKAVHDYWDDGKPCEYEKFTGKKCRIPYIPDPNGPDEVVD